MKEAYKDKIQEYRRNASTITPTASEQPDESTQSRLQDPEPPPPNAQSPPKSGTPGIKALSSYLDLSKVIALPTKELEMIWRLRFASDPQSLCAVIPLETYKRISKVAQSHPQFILPLPREIPEAERDGSGDQTAAEIHFLQWGFHPPSPSAPRHSLHAGQVSANNHTSTVIFTNLAAYKLHGAYAPPHTILTHHLDLADSHGIVLLSGSVVKDKGVSIDEGKLLVMQLQRFYDFEGMAKGRKRELVENFTKGEIKPPGQEGAGFSVEDLVEEASKMG